MKRIIEQLKEQRIEAEQAFIKNCLIERASPVNSVNCLLNDTKSDLDYIAELNEAISVLENHSMQKPKQL